jgi:16S rRNA (cytidine1402-2'-O)-methyltransferase
VGVTNSYSTALAAARDAAAQQHYPQAALYMVATPIGNLADISLRALHVLGLVDTVACEDTRHTQALLRAYGIDKPQGRLLALHQHNEAQASDDVLGMLRQDERVAYVSDAGTPGISDPGARLAAVVRSAGHPVIPLPGASSVTALLSVAGVAPAENHHAAGQGFVFHGFLPAKSAERIVAVQMLASESRCVVLLEAPHRITATVEALASLGDRLVTVGRELTKQFEDITTLMAKDLPGWLLADANRTRGEFALALHPAATAAVPQQGQRVLQLLMAELPLKTAVRLAADITGDAKNELYQAALTFKKTASTSG